MTESITSSNLGSVGACPTTQMNTLLFASWNKYVYIGINVKTIKTTHNDIYK